MFIRNRPKPSLLKSGSLSTVKGFGNYQFQKKGEPEPKVEQRVAFLASYRGRSALVRFHKGGSYSMPAAPLRDIGIKPGESFRLLVVRVGGKVQQVRVERIPPARPPVPPRYAPAVVVRRKK